MSKRPSNAGPACRVRTAAAIRGMVASSRSSAACRVRPGRNATTRTSSSGSDSTTGAPTARQPGRQGVVTLRGPVDGEQPGLVARDPHDVVTTVVGGHPVVAVGEPATELHNPSSASLQDVDAVEQEIRLGGHHRRLGRGALLVYTQSCEHRPVPLPEFRRSGTTPAHEQIERWVADAVTSGRLGPGTRLPAERDLAARLGVSRMTLRRALDSLERRGLVRRRIGRTGGTFVEASHRVELDLSRLARVHPAAAGSGAGAGRPGASGGPGPGPEGGRGGPRPGGRSAGGRRGAGALGGR